jgi:nucleoid-associated protein YgaU
VTRELKLALIVGFALVLVVTVLISDHMSHARQTKLAQLPPDPVRMTEPAPIALEAGADTLPLPVVTEPSTVAPAALIGSSPMSEMDPVVITQGNGLRVGPTGPVIPGEQPRAAAADGARIPSSVPPLNSAPQVIAQSPRDSGIEAAVRNQGGHIQGDTIYVPGLQTAREVTAREVPSSLQPPAPAPAPLRVTEVATSAPFVPAVPDRVHVVASGDSVFKLCAKYYGDGKVWRKLAKYNGLSETPPPALKIGQKLKVPSAEVLLGRAPVAPAATPSTVIPAGPAPQVRQLLADTGAIKTRPYVVKKGDSLAAIAQKELGTIKRANEILELNKKVIKTADNIPLGATLQIPG